MPHASNDGVDCYYETAGSGETVAFVEDAGVGAWGWGWQHRALAGPYETLTWDLRGTARSDAPEAGYSVATLAADLEAVLSDHGARRVHLVGSGLGGMVALEHALEYGRTRSLALFGTAADGEALQWAADATCVEPGDADAVRDALGWLLSARFREAHRDVVEGIVEWCREDDPGPAACRRQVAAMAAFDASDRLHELTAPALVVHGVEDRLVPVAAGERLADGLPRGEFAGFDGAGHLVGVERSRPVNDRLLGFLDRITD